MVAGVSCHDCRRCNDAVVSLIIGWTPLHEASNHGRISVARELLRAGADSNAQGLDNNSPLHDAAINGHVEVRRSRSPPLLYCF